MYYLKVFDLHRSFVMRWEWPLTYIVPHFISLVISPEAFKESLSLKSGYCSRGIPRSRGEDLAFTRVLGTPAGGTKILQAMWLGNHSPAPTPANKEELPVSSLFSARGARFSGEMNTEGNQVWYQTLNDGIRVRSKPCEIQNRTAQSQSRVCVVLLTDEREFFKNMTYFTYLCLRIILMQ